MTSTEELMDEDDSLYDTSMPGSIDNARRRALALVDSLVASEKQKVLNDVERWLTHYSQQFSVDSPRTLLYEERRNLVKDSVDESQADVDVILKKLGEMRQNAWSEWKKTEEAIKSIQESIQRAESEKDAMSEEEQTTIRELTALYSRATLLKSALTDARVHLRDCEAAQRKVKEKLANQRYFEKFGVMPPSATGTSVINSVTERNGVSPQASSQVPSLISQHRTPMSSTRSLIRGHSKLSSTSSNQLMGTTASFGTLTSRQSQASLMSLSSNTERDKAIGSARQPLTSSRASPGRFFDQMAVAQMAALQEKSVQRDWEAEFEAAKQKEKEKQKERERLKEEEEIKKQVVERKKLMTKMEEEEWKKDDIIFELRRKIQILRKRSEEQTRIEEEKANGEDKKETDESARPATSNTSGLTTAALGTGSERSFLDNKSSTTDLLLQDKDDILAPPPHHTHSPIQDLPEFSEKAVQTEGDWFSVSRSPSPFNSRAPSVSSLAALTPSGSTTQFSTFPGAVAAVPSIADAEFERLLDESMDVPLTASSKKSLFSAQTDENEFVKHDAPQISKENGKKEKKKKEKESGKDGRFKEPFPIEKYEKLIRKLRHSAKEDMTQEEKDRLTQKFASDVEKVKNFEEKEKMSEQVEGELIENKTTKNDVSNNDAKSIQPTTSEDEQNSILHLILELPSTVAKLSPKDQRIQLEKDNIELCRLIAALLVEKDKLGVAIAKKEKKYSSSSKGKTKEQKKKR
ncbi:uncharacterized protein MONOS_6557 [Monocercomonoides exilis]|uniref:uncharacterized protein n=1 Tax=Monocercomonoides exilis TaxID=2049356 RepID=UPI00355A8FB0|nr:hypothetical protein MONOS_6557 [Monocercomonoides exilis]|eukprot:MONOS_6557.1-p1 / transcript=MONOS_6557.1 / gene=MONOS_6557 / organism=Monocercomonoides_exilis_PA203 / gene_product=unspecified product / transcript_product=unspecified product / location=Mono_scaffold00208:45179-47839(-) / protein_length=747 / sequence_SO=supercontig / SO=protein_coding / is_pseudo=false